MILTLKILWPKVSLEGRDSQRLLLNFFSRQFPVDICGAKYLKKKKKKESLFVTIHPDPCFFWKVILKMISSENILTVQVVSFFFALLHDYIVSSCDPEVL